MTGDIDAVAVVVKRVGLGAVTNTLARSDATTFAAANGQTTVTFASSVETAVQTGEPLSFWLTDSTLELSAEPLVVEAGAQPLSFKTADALTDLLPDGLTYPGYNAYADWSFQNAAPTLISHSTGGDTHVFYLRFAGPQAVLAQQAAKYPDKFKLMSDGSYYVPATNPRHPLACRCGCKTPKEHVFLVLQQKRELPQLSVLDAVSMEVGFHEGLVLQGIDDVKATGEFVWGVHPFNPSIYRRGWAFGRVAIGNATTEQCELVAGIGSVPEDASAFVQGAWNLWQMAQGSYWGTLAQAASGDWEEANEQSETMRWMMAYMAELVVAVNTEYVAMSPRERGRIQGRITLEAGMIVLPFTKAANVAQASKVTVLTRLSEVGWIQENQQLLNIITRLITTTESRSSFRVGTEIAGAGERVAGLTAMKMRMAAGAATEDAYLAAMIELPANAGEYNVALRAAGVSRDVIRELSLVPGSEEYQCVLKVRGARNLIERKGMELVEVADDHSPLDIIYDLTVPGGKTQIHHGAPEFFQKRLKALGYTIADMDNCPAMIFSQIEHVGISPYSAASLHEKMKAFNGGVLSFERVASETDAKFMMDNFIAFYKEEAASVGYSGFEKAMRAWAQANGIPFTAP